jgi:hypothetical protein
MIGEMTDEQCLQVFNAHQKCAREKQERIEQRQIGGISEL